MASQYSQVLDMANRISHRAVVIMKMYSAASSWSSWTMLWWVSPVVTALASQRVQLVGSAVSSGPALVSASLVLTTER